VQRLIEQPAGEGEVLDGDGARVGRVHYHLSVYQHFSDVESEPVPASLEVEGRIVARDDFDLAKLIGRAELVLALGDGRMLDFLIVDAAGAIRSTGRVLYRP
jgi:hypothetical protein